MSALLSLLDPPAIPLLNVGLKIVSADVGIEHGGLSALTRGEHLPSGLFTKIDIEGMPMAWSNPFLNLDNPERDQNFFFSNVRADSEFKLTLLSKDTTNVKSLGDAQINMNRAIKYPDEVIALPITRGDRKAGVISIKVTHERIDGDANAMIKEIGPVRYSVHKSYIAGALKKLTSNGENWKSLTYVVHLHNIPQFLPTNIGWDKNRASIHRIFETHQIGSSAIRGAMKTSQNLILKHNKKSTKYGNFEKADDFFKLIRDGRRKGKPVLFTYVITSKDWIFSETGSGFFKDMMSKHAVFTGIAESVKYAGEFRIEVMNDGARVLVLDNNSGSYTPSSEILPQVKLLIEDNFKHILCKVLAQDDAEAIARRKEILDAWA